MLLEECKPESEQINRINAYKTMNFLSTFQSNLTCLRFLKMTFTLKYSKNSEFLGFFFLCFHLVLNFLEFPVFFALWKICYSNLAVSEFENILFNRHQKVQVIKRTKQDKLYTSQLKTSKCHCDEETTHLSVPQESGIPVGLVV